MAAGRPSQEHFWGRQMPAAPGIPPTPPPVAPEHARHAPYTPKPPPHAPQQPAPRPPPPAADVADAFAEPVSAFSSALPRGERVHLYRDKREEELFADKNEDLSAAFSVITATERLENIWARRGAISEQDYTRQCEELIRQFHVLNSTGNVPKLDKFIAEYDIKASKAHPRLRSGVPATVLDPGSSAAASSNQSKFVFRCTSLFHSLANCIDMGQLTVGILMPELTSLMRTLNGIKGLGPDFECKRKIRYWVEKLNAIPAAVELTEDEAKQLKLDLDTGYVELESAVEGIVG